MPAPMKTLPPAPGPAMVAEMLPPSSETKPKFARTLPPFPSAVVELLAASRPVKKSVPAAEENAWRAAMVTSPPSLGPKVPAEMRPPARPHRQLPRTARRDGTRFNLSVFRRQRASPFRHIASCKSRASGATFPALARR